MKNSTADSKSANKRQPIAVPGDVADLARKIAGAFIARGTETDFGLVTADAIRDFYSRLPDDMRAFIEAPPSSEPAALASGK